MKEALPASWTRVTAPGVVSEGDAWASPWLHQQRQRWALHRRGTVPKTGSRAPMRRPPLKRHRPQEPVCPTHRTPPMVEAAEHTSALEPCKGTGPTGKPVAGHTPAPHGSGCRHRAPDAAPRDPLPSSQPEPPANNGQGGRLCPGSLAPRTGTGPTGKPVVGLPPAPNPGLGKGGCSPPANSPEPSHGSKATIHGGPPAPAAAG